MAIAGMTGAMDGLHRLADAIRPASLAIRFGESHRLAVEPAAVVLYWNLQPERQVVIVHLNGS